MTGVAEETEGSEDEHDDRGLAHDAVDFVWGDSALVPRKPKAAQCEPLARARCNLMRAALKFFAWSSNDRDAASSRYHDM